MKAQTQIDVALLRRRLAPLLAGWERQARRIDALSLRERAILFLSVVAVVAALFDTLVLAPQSARAKLRSEQQAQLATELAQLREQFVAASRNAGDPSNGLRNQLDAALAERARLDDALREAGSVSGGEGLSVVLQRLLAQQPGLTLEKLVLLEDTPVSLASAGASPRPPALTGMSWQGVELRVLGRYGDVQRYLQTLERELPGLRWGDMQLSAGIGNEPPRLQAQVFLLKVQP
jgi:MSHA biogenesis protein MshJ